MDKLISVIIPTYKRPALLNRTLKSLSINNPDFLDVIVIDDDPAMSASTVVSEFSQIRYYAKRGLQRGLSHSRNIGIKLSVGKYLIFIDDDDYFCQLGIDIFKASIHPLKTFYYADFIYLRNDRSEIINQSQTLSHKLLVFNTVPIGSFMIEKTAINSEFDITMRSHEDWDFLLNNVNWSKSLYINNQVVNIDKTQIGDESMQNRRRNQFWLDYLAIYSKHPAPELAEQRSNTLSSLGIDIPPNLLKNNIDH